MGEQTRTATTSVPHQEQSNTKAPSPSRSLDPPQPSTTPSAPPSTNTNTTTLPSSSSHPLPNLVPSTTLDASQPPPLNPPSASASTSASPKPTDKDTHKDKKRRPSSHLPPPQGLPKEWSSSYLLGTKNSVLKRLKTVAATGGLHIELTLQPHLTTSLTKASIPTTPTSTLLGPEVALKAGLHPSLFPRILARWRAWCTTQGLAPLPIMGAVVCIFLADGIPPAERQQVVFVLELVRRATVNCFLAFKREEMKLKWEVEQWAMYDVVLEQAQWALPEWRAIAELAPPVLAARPKEQAAVAAAAETPTPPLPAQSTSKHAPQPHPNTKYLAPGERRLPTKPGTTSRPSSGSSTPNLPPQQQQPPRPNPPPAASSSTTISQPTQQRPNQPAATARPSFTNGQAAPPPNPVVNAPLSAKAQGKRPATGPPQPSTAPPTQKPKRKRRTKAEIERERAEIEEELEERGFYAAAARLSTSITMLNVLKNPNHRPSVDMQVIAGAAPPTMMATSEPYRRETLPIAPPAVSLFARGGKGPVVAAPLPPSSAISLPPSQTRLTHPFLDFTPTPAPSSWSSPIPSFAPIDNGSAKPFLPLTAIPLPTITALPIPRPPPESTFLLSPRQLLPWPKAIQPLTQEMVNTTWETIQSTMASVAQQHAQEPEGAKPKVHEVVQRAIQFIDGWCPKAKSPAEQIEAAKAKEANGGKTPKLGAVKGSPRIPVLQMSGKGSPRLAPGQFEAIMGGKGLGSPVVAHSPLVGNGSSSASSSRESTPMTGRRPSVSRSSTGNGSVHPLAQMWAKGTIEQRQVARELLLGAKGRSSPRSEYSPLASPRLNDTALQPTPPPPPPPAPLPSTSSDKAPPASTTSAEAAPERSAPDSSSHPTAPPLVPLPSVSFASTKSPPPASTTPTLSPQLPPPTADALLGSNPPPPSRLGASKLSTSVVLAGSTSPPLALGGVHRENSLLLEEGPAASASGGLSNSALAPAARAEVTKTVEAVAVVVKDKGKGKEKERESGRTRERERAAVVVVQKKETLAERKEAQKRRGGVPLRFQILNTPIRPFG